MNYFVSVNLMKGVNLDTAVIEITMSIDYVDSSRLKIEESLLLEARSTIKSISVEFISQSLIRACFRKASGCKFSDFIINVSLLTINAILYKFNSYLIVKNKPFINEDRPWCIVQMPGINLIRLFKGTDWPNEKIKMADLQSLRIDLFDRQQPVITNYSQIEIDMNGHLDEIVCLLINYRKNGGSL